MNSRGKQIRKKDSRPHDRGIGLLFFLMVMRISNLFMLDASESLAIGLWQRVICPIISRNQSTNEFFLRKSNVSA